MRSERSTVWKLTGAMLSSDTLGHDGHVLWTAGRDIDDGVYSYWTDGKAENGKLVADKLESLGKKYGCDITTTASMDMSSMVGGNDISIALYSDDLDLLRTTGSSIEKQLSKMKSS